MSRAADVTSHETEVEMEAALAELWKLFEVVHQWQLEQVDDSGRAAVEPGSPLAGDDRATAPYHMSHMVALALGVAVDHLHALRVAVQEATSLRLYAPYTLLRATIESAATVTYLLGESRRSERVRRRLMLVAQDNRDRANFLRAVGEPGGPSAEDRLSRLREVAARTPALDLNAIGGTPTGSHDDREDWRGSLVIGWRNDACCLADVQWACTRSPVGVTGLLGPGPCAGHD